MANKNLFRSFRGAQLPATDARNSEGAPAYRFGAEHALAQYAATGCLSSTFYAGAAEQLDQVLRLSQQVAPELVAKTALYSRQAGFMKDMPALLCAVLSVRAPELLERVFERVIDNGRMLRNFVQIVRSGVVGRRSLGSQPKRLVTRWLERRSAEQLLRDSVGQSPSLADVVKMVHPKPADPAREALYGYLLGRRVKQTALPQVVRDWEAFKQDPQGKETPRVPFRMLTSLPLQRRHWVAIARNARWQMTRMNLNTFARHGVFEVHGLTKLVAARLRRREDIERARVFPYQLMTAFVQAGPGVPKRVCRALQDAMEIAIGNLPSVQGKVFVCPDVSGSMTWTPATGKRRGATSVVRCVDVAALVAAAMLRLNPSAEVLPFEHKVVPLRLNARDSVMTNAAKLAAIGGGGTSCSAPLEVLNERRARGDLVVLVSDNESWVDGTGGRGTATMRQWARFKRRNPSARLVCLDIQPNRTTQAAEREDILNVGGFSDAVFSVIDAFAAGRLGADHWVGVIDQVAL